MKKLYEEQHISNIAGAIREKNGKTDSYKVADMAQAIKDIPTGGGSGSNTDALISSDAELNEYANENVYTLRDYAFYKTNIKKISLPNVTKLGLYSFRNCAAETIELPMLTSYYGGDADAWYAFQNCTNLKSISLPLVTSLVDFMFANCTSLEKAVFERCLTFEKANFYGCSKLKVVKFGKACNFTFDSTNASHYPFGKCSSLTAVIIGGTTVPTLTRSTAFATTPIASGTGYIYVPDNLVDSYKSATNWSTYATQIKPISEYVEE